MFCSVMVKKIKTDHRHQRKRSENSTEILRLNIRALIKLE